jgi:hypothetical protein
MTEITTSEIVDSTASTRTLEEIFTEAFAEVAKGASFLSPYKSRNVSNKVLNALGVNKVLPGPMFYTYCDKGYIETQDAANREVTQDALWTWLQKYIAKNATKFFPQLSEVDENAEVSESELANNES